MPPSHVEQLPALAPSLPAVPDDEFNLRGLRIFTSIPDHTDVGVVALHGLVAVYDRKPIYIEGIVEGAYYVREHQHTPARMPIDSWLRAELADPHVHRRAQPWSPLTVTREVVQPFRRVGQDRWWVRLESGFVDGPYVDWFFGRDLIGRVVGLYLPSGAAQGGQ